MEVTAEDEVCASQQFQLGRAIPAGHPLPRVMHSCNDNIGVIRAGQDLIDLPQPQSELAPIVIASCKPRARETRDVQTNATDIALYSLPGIIPFDAPRTQGV